jgi:O-6-methylguanine DNA methyltransferase
MTAKLPEELTLARYKTPIGVMLLAFDGEGALRVLDFEDYEPRMHKLLRRQYGDNLRLVDGAAPAKVTRALDRYFAGELAALDDIACATAGTPFQRRVWAALRQIPAGKTTSYGALAAKLGKPQAMRAVGLANGANPIGVVVPCHRVIGANGSLTGYGGGLHRKRWLLEHEGASFAG